MIKAVIFDIDGVLVDSVKGNIAMYKYMLKKSGYTEPKDEAIKELLHLPLWHGIKELIHSNDIDEINRVRDIIHEPGVSHVSLLEFPHNLELTLETLQRKYKLAIVTSRIKAGVAEIFDQKEIEHLFDVVISIEDVKNPKPHPEPLVKALDTLGLKPEEAVYIGDMDTDVEAAIAAGVKSIHLSEKHHRGATIGIAHFDEIIDVITKIERNELNQ